MPVYEYECSKCKMVHESARPVEWRGFKSVCPNCGGDANQIMALAAFSIKGFNAKNGYSDSVPNAKQ